MKKNLGAIFIALAVVSVSLTGCTQNNSDPNAVLLMAAKQAEAAGSPENAAALKDGKFTEDEYFAAARRFQACYRDQGVVITGPVVSPVDSLTLEWVYPDTYSLSAKGNRAIGKCIAQWSPMLAAYTATHKPHMDEGLRRAVAKCVRAAGYALTGKEATPGDFAGDQASSDGLRKNAVNNCIVDSAIKMFPNLPSVTINW